ncbi:MAG: hypothetical protein IT286_03800 [Proteobacteria bacterium]|nr:hypothetical protein [Pseudomonadota bacterium]
MKQVLTKKVFKFSLVVMAYIASGNCFADPIQDMFSYQAKGTASQKDFIRSNVEGLFEGQKISKRVSHNFSFEMVNLKTMHKQLDHEHRNTLENMTSIDLNYGKQFFSRIQLGNSRQDIGIFNQNYDFVADQQSMHGMSQGWKNSFGSIDAESTLGFVQCASSGEEKYYPIYGFKITRNFEDRGQLQLNIAQEILGGGSYTGIYGNQIFKKAMVNGRINILKKLSFLWDAGIGVSESTFDKEVAGVATMSASLEYSIGQNVKGNIGYSHRNLIDVETGSINAEGHMMSASLAVANF